MTSIGKILFASGVVLSLALLWLQNAKELPFGSGDFVFLFVVTVLAALYRPGWVFLGLVSVLPLETVNLAPDIFGIGLRPYQFFEIALVLGLLGRLVSIRSFPDLPKLHFIDVALFLVPVGSVFSLVNAPDPGSSFKLTLVILSFFGLYVLGRLYLQSIDDLRKILPFVLVSGAVAMLYAVFQNVRFLSGFDPFEVMPGRPNAAFPEPDWFGMYLSAVLPLVFFFGIPAVSSDEGSALRRSFRRVVPYLLTTFLFASLLMTVARSAWLGAFVSGSVFFLLLLFFERREVVKGFGIGAFSSFLVAVGLVVLVPLTRFDLLGRAASTAGSQEITVSCDRSVGLPAMVETVSELSGFGCRHIDLESVDAERAQGRFIATIDRPDPNIEIRKDIYAISWDQVMEHPILGIGWGSIGVFLGSDSRGAALNASNLFLEIWLGSGILGILGFMVAWFAPGVIIFRKLLRFRTYESSDAVVVSSWIGLTVCNLFNSGLLLGFMWVFLSVMTLAATDRGDVRES